MEIRRKYSDLLISEKAMAGTGKIANTDRMEIIDRLSDILEPWVTNIDPKDAVNEETNLILDLGLDSVGILQVVLGIEQEFGIKINNLELDSELLSKMRNMVNMIQRKLDEDN